MVWRNSFQYLSQSGSDSLSGFHDGFEREIMICGIIPHFNISNDYYDNRYDTSLICGRLKQALSSCAEYISLIADILFIFIMLYYKYLKHVAEY